VTSSSLVTTIWFIRYKRSKQIFPHNMNFMGLKRSRILRRFQKYKLTLVIKCTQKKISQGASCVETKSLFCNSFFRCILLQENVHIFEIYVKFCVCWYPWSPYCERKKFGPLYTSEWLKMKRSQGQKVFCCCYFRYFWKVWNKSEEYFCWKSKKVKNQPTLLCNMHAVVQDWTIS
jgi:hypothetical protein